MIGFNEYFIIESFIQAETKWIKDGNDVDEVKSNISAFKTLRQRNVLSGETSDISSWVKKPFDTFKQFINAKLNSVNNNQEIKNKQSSATKIFENDQCIVLVPNTYEASCKYGRGTKWCTASKDERIHWDSYHLNGYKLFYIIPKDNTEKYAIVSPPKIGGLDGYTADTKKPDAYNAKDILVSVSKVLNMFNIPSEVINND